jgi:hypothetical protein
LSYIHGLPGWTIKWLLHLKSTNMTKPAIDSILVPLPPPTILSKLIATPPPVPKTLTEQKFDFTAEGAPPPGKVATAVPVGEISVEAVKPPIKSPPQPPTVKQSLEAEQDKK